MKKVTEYFKEYPGSNKCFGTSDGYLFHEQGDAQLHANSLEDKTIIPHYREGLTVIPQTASDALNVALVNAGAAIEGETIVEEKTQVDITTGDIVNGDAIIKEEEPVIKEKTAVKTTVKKRK